MSPGIIRPEPESSNALKQAYKDGFEAGKASLKRELQLLIKSLPDIKTEMVSSSTTYLK